MKHLGINSCCVHIIYCVPWVVVLCYFLLHVQFTQTETYQYLWRAISPGAIVSNSNSAIFPTSSTKKSTTFRKLSLQSGFNEERGIVMCSSKGMVQDTLSHIEQLHEVFNTTIGITVFHCDELDANSKNMLLREPFTAVTNLCADRTGRFGMSYMETKARLRSFFCKTAALVMSPYKKTMVVDTDVVWFQSPELLFGTPLFLSTGTLFFRDKTTHAKKRQHREERVFQDELEAFVRAEVDDVLVVGNFSQEFGRSEVLKEGSSYFWQHVANKNRPALDNFQDSSVLLVDKERHPKLIHVLGRLIPRFKIGYGDKEIYWLASIVADEPYAFEPFSAASYGDCGLLMHYDPLSSGYVSDQTAVPFYLNGEWLMEKIPRLGEGLSYEMSKPVRALSNTTLHDLKASRGCSCRFVGCHAVPYHVNQLILRAQWLRLSRRLTRPTEESQSTVTDLELLNKKQCINIYTGENVPQEISDMLIKIHEEKLCRKYGCPYLPITLQESFLSMSRKQKLCLPITFSSFTKVEVTNRRSSYDEKTPSSSTYIPFFSMSPAEQSSNVEKINHDTETMLSMLKNMTEEQQKLSLL